MRLLKILCPLCRGYLEVDTETGKVLAHQAALKKEAGEKGLLEAAQENVSTRVRGAEEKFGQMLDDVARRKERMKEAFEKAREKAKESPEDERPVNPMDLD